MSLEAPLEFALGGGGIPAYSASAYASAMRSLLPPGRVWRWVGGLLTPLLDAMAQEFARVDARAMDLINESLPSSATEMLPEYEEDLDLEGTGTDEERQARIVARYVARQRYRPVDFQVALAPLLGQDAGDVVVIERTHAEALALGDDREIVRFFIYRDPAAPGTYYLDSAQQLVQAIKPTHTAGHVIESIDALYDDPFTLYDRDLLGA